MTQHLPTRAQTVRCIGMVLGATAFLSAAPVMSRADDNDARKILKSMSDYMAGQPVLSVRYDADIEVITPDLQKIQFTASGDVLLDREAGLRAARAGGYADVELIFDRKTIVIHNRPERIFTRIEAQGSVDQMIQGLRSEHGVDMPGADLLLAKNFDQLTEGMIEPKHIGIGVIDGVECEHLAFRNHDTDWQLWVEAGARPAPRKDVITSKTVSQAPQYTLMIKELRTDVKPNPAAFVFDAPDGAKQVALNALGDIDQVPLGVPAEESKP